MNRLIPPLDADQKAQVIARARQLLTANPKGGPVRFRHQGRTVRGIDCIGLLAWAFAGYANADRTDYGRLPADRKLDASMRQHFGEPLPRPVRLANLVPGDVLTMHWGAEAGHVALVTDHPNGVGIIHAWLSAGCVIEHGLVARDFARVLEVFRP